MYIRIISGVSMLGLTFAIGGFSGATSRLALEFLIAAAAGVITFVALRGHKYLWASLFAITFVAFNPVVPVLWPEQTIFWVELACLFLFALLLIRWKDNAPRPSVLSVIDPAPPRASL